MPETQLRSEQLGAGEVKRSDINIDESSAALITKVIAGTGLQLSSSTGVDSGTGDVTLAIDSHNHTVSDITDLTNGIEALTIAEVDQLEAIGLTTISAAQWGYLGVMNQELATTSNVTFNDLIVNGTAQLASGTTVNEFSIDGTLAGNSDNAIPTEQAVKTYVDAQGGGASALIDLTDVTITSVADDDILAYDSGSALWINQSAAEAGIEPAVNLTINRALISNASGGLAVSAVTNTELEHLSGVTSAVQTQLDGKSGTSHNHTLDGLSNTTIADITSGELLKWNGSAWVNNTLSEAGIASDSLATTSVAGIIELATIAETNPGSSTDRAITPDALGGSRFGSKSVCLVPLESDQSVVTGDGKVAFTIGQAMTGMNLTRYVASCHTTGSGTVTIQIRRRRAGTDANMLSTAITLTNEYHCTDGAIDTSYDDVQTGDQIYIDIDGVTATAPQGLSVTLEFGMP